MEPTMASLRDQSKQKDQLATAPIPADAPYKEQMRRVLRGRVAIDPQRRPVTIGVKG